MIYATLNRTVIPDPEIVIMDLEIVIMDLETVIPDLIRDPWIAGQARNDSGIHWIAGAGTPGLIRGRNDSLGAATTDMGRAVFHAGLQDHDVIDASVVRSPECEKLHDTSILPACPGARAAVWPAIAATHRPEALGLASLR